MVIFDSVKHVENILNRINTLRMNYRFKRVHPAPVRRQEELKKRGNVKFAKVMNVDTSTRESQDCQFAAGRSGMVVKAYFLNSQMIKRQCIVMVAVM